MTDRSDLSVPRVLVVSVNPLSETSNNGKTIASFFKGYPKGRLAHLYFHREPPSSDTCDNYARITDAHILRYVRRVGREPVAVEMVSFAAREAGSSIMPQRSLDLVKNWWWLRLARALVWRCIPWQSSPGLTDWLTRFGPQVIFFCGGDANYLYSAVESWSRRFGAPVVLYVTDDYILPAKTGSVARTITRLWTRYAFLRMARTAPAVLTIGDRMEEVYRSRFGVESTPLMNAVDVESFPERQLGGSRDPVSFVYVGSLHSNRGQVLVYLGEALRALRERGISCELIYYARAAAEGDLRLALERSGVRYGGCLDAEGVRGALASADVAVHVEAFDAGSRLVTHLSLSTKIPEYMAAGAPVLAIGPSEIASMRYVRDGGFGLSVNSLSQSDIIQAAARLAGDPELRRELGRNGRNLALEQHDVRRCAPLVQGLLGEAAKHGLAKDHEGPDTAMCATRPKRRSDEPSKE